jgi:hypothetical protein
MRFVPPATRRTLPSSAGKLRASKKFISPRKFATKAEDGFV